MDSLTVEDEPPEPQAGGKGPRRGRRRAETTAKQAKPAGKEKDEDERDGDDEGEDDNDGAATPAEVEKASAATKSRKDDKKGRRKVSNRFPCPHCRACFLDFFRVGNLRHAGSVW